MFGEVKCQLVKCEIPFSILPTKDLTRLRACLLKITLSAGAHLQGDLMAWGRRGRITRWAVHLSLELGWPSASSWGIFWEEAVYFQRELWVFGTKVEGIPRGKEGHARDGGEVRSPDFGQGKERERERELERRCCLGAGYDWPVYRAGAAKGRFSLWYRCSSFGRTRNGTGACPASDLTCRRDDGTPSFLSLLHLALIRVFCVPVGASAQWLMLFGANGLA